MASRARRLGGGILVLAACGGLGACGSSSTGSPSGPGTPITPTPPPGETASWGFFAYTSDLVSGLSTPRWSRVTGVVWTDVEPAPGSGTYRWGDLDGRVTFAQANGLNVVLVLKAGNGASFSDPDCLAAVDARAAAGGFPSGRKLASCPIRADMEDAWSRMVSEVVERYDGDGNADMPGLSATVRVDIQIENEAANRELWDYVDADRGVAAERYLRLLELSYGAKQAADSRTQVILSGLFEPNLLARCAARPGDPACSAEVAQNLAFSRRILDRPDLFDAVDVHFFVYYHFEPDFIDDGFQWVAGQMQQRGYQRPVYALEWTGAMMLHVSQGGYGDAFARYFPYAGDFPTLESFQAMYVGLDRPENAAYRAWFEAEQAKEFGKLFSNMLALGLDRLVHVQYSDYRPGAWNNVWWNWQGVIKYVGGTAVRKPSYYTFNILSERLFGFTAARRVGEGGAVRLYEFSFPTKAPTWVLWTDGPAEMLDLSLVVASASVRITPLVTELSPDGSAVIPPEEVVPTSAVPAGDVPVLLQEAS